MANSWYAKGKEGFAKAGVNWETDDIRAILVDVGAYTVNLATHDFLDDVPAGARIAVSADLPSKTATDGILDAGDLTGANKIAAVTGATVEAIVIYKHTGTEATSRLLLYLDTASGTPGLPFTPNGTDVEITWSNGADKIAKL